ncbi:MAG: Rne/Rng family ribonuclease [Hyphomonadaceae bacterium]|nr:Rne/Rng family ribonuclease [Hyphomonadaceae bacterium]
MAKRMLIDAAHPEETRVVVLDGHRVDDFDFETQNKKQLRGNIYLAKVTRVEPSLQAAFVEYGGNRHGFLAFGEIHPDYYSIPVADREALKAEFDAVAGDADAGDDDEEGGDDDGEIEEKRRRILTRRYKIQEVIKRRQIMLIQVVKEERGNKGAALTTYLSLAGRYCVLMPNTGRGGGISRKITNSADRKRLKKVASELDVPQGMGLIVRTAGAKRTKTEIKRDYEYLSRAWETIRDKTMSSVAPALIYEESSLVKRAIRDLYDKDVEDIHVEGEAAFKEAKDFIRMLMPSHAKKVHLYKEPTPIFTGHGVERQLETIYSPAVTLRSGGYIVINQTEALVSIDVNSGRSTRERNIEQTALKTNMEAAEEAARQMRLRDLAGLIVIDFIDMDEAKNDRMVEKKMKDALRFDRARVQMGKISGFGLLELSRQRRRTGILEGSSHVCPMCSGLGRVRSVESSALHLLRVLDEEALRRGASELEARAPTDVAIYLLNEKRAALAAIEDNRNVRVRVSASTTLMAPDFEIIATGQRELDPDADAEAMERPRRDREERFRNDRQRPRYVAPEVEADGVDDDVAEDVEDADPAEERRPERGAGGESDGDASRRRRRGRRGGKKRREGEGPSLGAEGDGDAAAELPRSLESREPRGDGERGPRRKRRRRGRGRRPFEIDGGENLDLIATDPVLFGAAAAAETTPEATGVDVAGPAAPVGGDDPAPARAERAPARRRAPRVAAADVPELVAEADDPAASMAPPLTPASAPEGVAPPAPSPTADPAPAPGQAASLVAPDPAPDPYEPDLERREKFFARLSKWGKKA